MDIDSLVREKLDADTDFQNSLTELSDEDKLTATENRKKEILSNEFKSLKEKADKEAETARNQKIRAEKAEALAKNSAGEGAPKNPDLSTKDVLAFASAKVHQDDVDEVIKAAKLLGITPAEALSDSLVKGILERREESRKASQAANTSSTRTVKKQSDTELMQKVSAGEIPAKGSEDAERLFWARRGGKKK